MITMTDTPANGDTGGAPAGADSAAWIASLDEDSRGYLTNRGLHDKPLADIAAASIKAHREAERLLGRPATDFLIKPKDASDEANHQAIRDFLGVPKDATGYKFDGLKFADGTDLDPATQDWLRGVATKIGLPAERAGEFAQEFIRFSDAAEADASAETTAKVEEGRAALKANWGQSYDANMVVAKNAFSTVMQESGLTPEQYGEAMTALENQVGYKGLMEVFRTIGLKMGEDKFVSNDAKTGLMTRDGATARLNELKADQAWVTRLNNGDTAARKEFEQLTTIMSAD
jgi:hypothetical protein